MCGESHVGRIDILVRVVTLRYARAETIDIDAERAKLNWNKKNCNPLENKTVPLDEVKMDVQDETWLEGRPWLPSFALLSMILAFEVFSLFVALMCRFVAEFCPFTRIQLWVLILKNIVVVISAVVSLNPYFRMTKTPGIALRDMIFHTYHTHPAMLVLQLLEIIYDAVLAVTYQTGTLFVIRTSLAAVTLVTHALFYCLCHRPLMRDFTLHYKQYSRKTYPSSLVQPQTIKPLCCDCPLLTCTHRECEIPEVSRTLKKLFLGLASAAAVLTLTEASLLLSFALEQFRTEDVVMVIPLIRATYLTFYMHRLLKYGIPGVRNTNATYTLRLANFTGLFYWIDLVLVIVLLCTHNIFHWRILLIAITVTVVRLSTMECLLNLNVMVLIQIIKYKYHFRVARRKLNFIIDDGRSNFM